ncbi:MAG: ABC transporter permease [Proteobacteria bacterium]|nr:ABC transporter permease [Pseudomonadota bacterium]MBU1060280.1 ABC transporter permease [Pseudomonadota bacterium]
MTNHLAILAKPLAFLVRDFKIAASYRLQFVMQSFGIILTTFSFFLISKMIGGQHISQLEPYGGDYFSFVLIGIALTDYLTISTNSFAAEIRSAQMVGTLESLLVTPTSIYTILLSSFLYKLLSTSLRMVFYLLLGVFVFGIEYQTGGVFTLAVTFLLTLLSFFGLGLFSAAFIIVFKQGNPISSLMAMSSGLLGGVIYPVTVLPDWLRPLSSILPITHGLEAMRQVLLNGAGLEDISRQLYILTLLSILFMGIGCGSIYYSLKIAKKEGSLLHY